MRYFCHARVSNIFSSFCSASVGQRSKRRRVEKKSASAFEKLRELKSGGRSKWDSIEETEKLYDEVDEDEYTKIVSARASDWIVGDGELCKEVSLNIC